MLILINTVNIRINMTYKHFSTFSQQWVDKFMLM